MQDVIGGLSQKMRLKRSKGEMVEVEGGRIIRSLGRKDRHSKVCTSKGPRDRRVRLSADAAIQFYDVQDRLGYDRPSKAIDWLMKEAKAAIDALNENQLELPVNASFYNPSQAFNRTPGEGIQNGQNFNDNTFGFFDNYPDLHLSLQEKPIHQQENLFSASNTVEQYFIGQNQLFAHDREHLQSSFPPSIQAAINGFDNDDEFLGFPFPQEIQGKEEDQVSSGISLLHYQ